MPTGWRHSQIRSSCIKHATLSALEGNLKKFAKDARQTKTLLFERLETTHMDLGEFPAVCGLLLG
jgi:hypothetical protein